MERRENVPVVLMLAKIAQVHYSPLLDLLHRLVYSGSCQFDLSHRRLALIPPHTPPLPPLHPLLLSRHRTNYQDYLYRRQSASDRLSAQFALAPPLAHRPGNRSYDCRCLPRCAGVVGSSHRPGSQNVSLHSLHSPCHNRPRYPSWPCPKNACVIHWKHR